MHPVVYEIFLLDAGHINTSDFENIKQTCCLPKLKRWNQKKKEMFKDLSATTENGYGVTEQQKR